MALTAVMAEAVVTPLTGVAALGLPPPPPQPAAINAASVDKKNINLVIEDSFCSRQLIVTNITNLINM